MYVRTFVVVKSPHTWLVGWLYSENLLVRDTL